MTTDNSFEEAFSEAETPAQEQSEPKAAETPPAEEQPKAPESAAETQTPEAAAPPPATPPAQEAKKPDETSWQHHAYLDEKAKRQKLEAELEEYRRLQAQQHEQSKKQTPDIYENPEAYKEHLEKAVQDSLLTERLNTSELIAEQQYGAEIKEAAKAWALEQMRTNPSLQQQILSSPHPYGEAVRRYKQAEILKEVGEDPAAYKARIIAEYEAAKAAQTPPAPAAQQPQPQARPQQPVLPPQVAGSGGGTRTAPQMTDGDFFESVFET